MMNDLFVRMREYYFNLIDVEISIYNCRCNEEILEYLFDYRNDIDIMNRCIENDK